MGQAVLERPVAALPFLNVKSCLHAASVYGDLFLCFTVKDRQASLSAFVREQIETDVPFAALKGDLRCAGQRIAALFSPVKDDLFVPEFAQFRQRLLDQSSSPYSQLSGQCQAPRPVLFICRVGDVGHAHPGDQDGFVRILQVVGAGRRVGIKSEVQDVELAVRREGQGLPVHLSDDVAVVIPALPSSGDRQVLGAQKQYVPASDVLHRRALPHIAKRFKSRHFHLSQEGPPVLQVLRRIDECTAPLILGLRADYHIVELTPRNADDLGIPLVLRVVGIGAEQRQRIFLRPAVVSEPGEAGVGVPGPVRVAVVSRVIKVYFVINRHGGA